MWWYNLILVNQHSLGQYSGAIFKTSIISQRSNTRKKRKLKKTTKQQRKRKDANKTTKIG
jgi:hypothetical protein